MSEFKIEKLRHPLEVTLNTGEHLKGMVFLEPTARMHSGPQDPRELLNDEDAFFPIAVDGRLLLVAKDNVKIVVYQVDAGGASVSPQTVDVRVTLVDRGTVDGAIEVEVRSDAQRLLDYINEFDARFLSMSLDGATRCLVNRRMISVVQQR